MARDRYEFDAASFNFLKKTGVNAWRTLRIVLRFILVSFSLTAVAYSIFALVFSTDVERRLRRENKAYEKMFPALVANSELLSDAVAGLQYKDNEIYEQIFHSTAPSVDPMSNLDYLFASDTIPDIKLASYTRDKSDMLVSKSEKVEKLFTEILLAVADTSFVSPPMALPLQNVTYPQTGASVGMKMNPFYKAYVMHSGVDFMAERGTPVFATAPGVVVTPSDLTKSMGTVVEIRHEGGYVTRYEHLDEAFVSPGQKVRKGSRIGAVGMSGNSYAPHLHYGVYKDGVACDPVNFLFASVTPFEYANMLYMSVNTMQSMD